jgi:hypothetical protein
MNFLLRLILIVYFVTHIPISIFVDLQTIFPVEWYPEVLQKLVKWYASTHGDFLIANPPQWFKTCIWFEVFQVPYFFAATYALIYKHNWIRVPSLVYGAHVTTVVSAILSEFLVSESLSRNQKLVLFSFYFPYWLMPAILTVYFTLVEKAFPEKSDKKKFN